MLRRALHRVGLDLVRHQPCPEPWEEDIEILDGLSDYTLTTVERLWGLVHATRYVVSADIPGSIVECGVWRGGSMMAVARTLEAMGESTRDLYLFDTFEGMSPPTDADVSRTGMSAVEEYRRQGADKSTHFMAYCSLDDVRASVTGTGYPRERIHFVKGKVEDTLPEHAPSEIALLRLDTDWYESTLHELEHLFPRLATGGVLIIDDYGHWQGSQRATDEYLERHGVAMLLNRLDYAGRIGVKTNGSWARGA